MKMKRKKERIEIERDKLTCFDVEGSEEFVICFGSKLHLIDLKSKKQVWESERLKIKSSKIEFNTSPSSDSCFAFGV